MLMLMYAVRIKYFQNDKPGIRYSGLHEKSENIEKDNVSGKILIVCGLDIIKEEKRRSALVIVKPSSSVQCEYVVG